MHTYICVYMRVCVIVICEEKLIVRLVAIVTIVVVIIALVASHVHLTAVSQPCPGSTMPSLLPHHFLFLLFSNSEIIFSFISTHFYHYYFFVFVAFLPLSLQCSTGQLK